MQSTRKVALVTGGSRGMGRAIVRRLAASGIDTVFTYRQERALATALSDEMRTQGHAAHALPYDATEGAEEETVEAAWRIHGRLDIVVNNAGCYEAADLLSATAERVERIFTINALAPARMCRAAARQMIADKRAGAIVNILSVAADRPRPTYVHYAAAKAAAAVMTRGAASEWAQHGIRVNGVSPGLVATDMNAFVRADTPDVWRQQVAAIPLGRPGSPEDIAGAVLYLVSDEAAWTTGSIITIDGGRTAG